MMDQKVKDKIAAAEAHATSAALAWLEKNEPDIEAVVYATLQRRVDQVVLKLLGFDRSYSSRDEWQVDHCNGRSGESAAGDWIRARAGDAVRAWLDLQAGALPTLSKSAADSLRFAYTQTLEHELRRLVSDKAVEDAKDAVAKICAA